MKTITSLIVLIALVSCTSSVNRIEIDKTYHSGLKKLNSDTPYTILYSKDILQQASVCATLVEEAYLFLSQIMGPKKEFCLCVISEEEWQKKIDIPIMPFCWKGNVVFCPGKNVIADGTKMMIESLPREISSPLVKTYTNNQGELDMNLYAQKLVIHELMHNFQDPKNGENIPISWWLIELHANMGLYAFYKAKHPDELKYITTLADFTIAHPSADIKHTSLSDFDSLYSALKEYGYYQMKFTKAAQIIIDSMGNDILKPVNDFIIKYDGQKKEGIDQTKLKMMLADKVDPYVIETMNRFFPD